MMAPRIAGLSCCQSPSVLVTVTKSEPKNTPVTPGTSNRRAASGERLAESRLKSNVPLSSMIRLGMNFSVAGLGVGSGWLDMVFSGVAGSRPAREVSLADGVARRTIKGRGAAVPALHQGFRAWFWAGRLALAQGWGRGSYDRPSIS